MFESTKNKFLYTIFISWAFLFFSLSVVKIFNLFQQKQNFSLESLIFIFTVLEVIVLWMLLISVSLTLISKSENITKTPNLFLILSLFNFIINSLINLIINNQVLKIMTQLSLILVVFAVTVNLLINKNPREELFKNTILISLKISWAVISAIVIVFNTSITLNILNLLITLTMVPLSVYFISLKNVDLKTQDILSPLNQQI